MLKLNHIDSARTLEEVLAATHYLNYTCQGPIYTCLGPSSKTKVQEYY
jgi:hypothetical protein